MRDVNDAISRILEGTYGVCESSGAAIPASRLRALPWCRYSVEAERRFERGNGKVLCRVPDVVSLRGRKSDLPGTGTYFVMVAAGFLRAVLPVISAN